MRFGTILLVVVMFVGMAVLGRACSWFGEAASVAREEFGPRAALQKYEWFKDQAEAITALQENITTYRQVLVNYGDVSKLPRDERQSYRLTQTELSGMVFKVNRMIADYNSQSDKFNWELFNAETDRPPFKFNSVK